MSEVWLLLTLAALVTFASRLAGMVLAGRVAPTDPILQWVACIAYALLAGLVARMLLLPIGPLKQTEMPERIAAVAVALAVWLVFRKNILLGVLAGTVTLTLLTAPPW